MVVGVFVVTSWWSIAEPRYLKPESVYSGKKSVPTFFARGGVYPSRKAAVRAYMEALNPEIRGQSDSRIQAHWSKWQRLGYAKCVRLTLQEVFDGKERVD